MAGTDHRPHQSHNESDKCPVCGRAWVEWPNAHKADLVCSQRCEKSEEGKRLIAYELHKADIVSPVDDGLRRRDCTRTQPHGAHSWVMGDEYLKCNGIAEPENAAGTVW